MVIILITKKVDISVFVIKLHFGGKFYILQITFFKNIFSEVDEDFRALPESAKTKFKALLHFSSSNIPYLHVRSFYHKVKWILLAYCPVMMLSQTSWSKWFTKV